MSGWWDDMPRVLTREELRQRRLDRIKANIGWYCLWGLPLLGVLAILIYIALGTLLGW